MSLGWSKAGLGISSRLIHNQNKFLSVDKTAKEVEPCLSQHCTSQATKQRVSRLLLGAEKLCWSCSFNSRDTLTLALAQLVVPVLQSACVLCLGLLRLRKVSLGFAEARRSAWLPAGGGEVSLRALFVRGVGRGFLEGNTAC